ncbi:MAG: DUF3623 family protein [Chloroflexales bacterium]|nr:DUF3623 family protein [Chloroflexales bacterium]
MLSPPPAWLTVYIYPLIAAVVLWAGLTALVAGLNRRGPGPGRIALVVALPLLALAHRELWATSADGSLAGTYRAFMAGTVIWAWHELAFYSGVLTGPWRAPCPTHARGLTRFGYALGTHLFHELAVVVELTLMLMLLRGGTNATGLLVFVLSWALQHSAKLNVLFGVPALNVDLFPPHLRYLGSYWRRRTPRGFFLPSVSVTTLLAIMLWSAAHAHSLEPAGVRLALLAALVSLGAVEHWMLALPGRRVAAGVPTAGAPHPGE